MAESTLHSWVEFSKDEEFAPHEQRRKADRMKTDMTLIVLSLL
jgi:hypothetical protein